MRRALEVVVRALAGLGVTARGLKWAALVAGAALVAWLVRWLLEVEPWVDW